MMEEIKVFCCWCVKGTYNWPTLKLHQPRPARKKPAWSELLYTTTWDDLFTPALRASSVKCSAVGRFRMSISVCCASRTLIYRAPVICFLVMKMGNHYYFFKNVIISCHFNVLRKLNLFFFPECFQLLSKNHHSLVDMFWNYYRITNL